MTKRNTFLYITALLALLCLLFPDAVVQILSNSVGWIIEIFDTYILWAMSALLLAATFICFSPLGSIRLGNANDKPEFGTWSWLAMLFAAGMGSGLIFWGVAEPVFHLNAPINPYNDPGMAFAATYFHWGFHAWAIYGVSGLTIAWFVYKHQRPMNISGNFSADKKSNWRWVDLLALIAIFFGVAGTLANSIALIETGSNQLAGVNYSGLQFRIILLLCIALAFLLSSLSGLKKGIRLLSNFNLLLASVFLLAIVLLTDVFQLGTTVWESTLTYLKHLPTLSTTIADESRDWSHDWSIIYLLWWVAWAPFTGLFIARISKGRTVREFFLGVVLVPTLMSIIWFSALGGGAMDTLDTTLLSNAVRDDYTMGLFVFLNELPFGGLLSATAMTLLVVFVVTSADSAIYVTGLLTGDQSKRSRLVWGLLLVALTLALLYENNVDLNKLIAIVGAIPFMGILLMQLVVLIKSLSSDYINSKRQVDK